MILTDIFDCKPDLNWSYALQTGIRHGVIKLPEDEEFDITSISHWQNIHNRFTDFGIKPILVEPMPNFINEHIKRGDDLRDKSIQKIIEFLPIMDKLDIRTICMNFMAYYGWFRSRKDIPERGGALVTGFYHEDIKDADPIIITKEQLWANLEYFLKAVVPHLERYNINIAFHPDDPPVERLGNVCRILTSRDALDKAIGLVPSKNVGVTMCQGCYAAMGEDVIDTIHHFGKMNKIFFVHFRDVCGNRHCFHETFHDNGQTNMVKSIQTYKEIGYQGPIRVDHVPTMAGEENAKPGYTSVGRLYAIGYLKGLLEGCGYQYY